ncbi:MAG: hypothetical protein F6K40_27240 [Okeania sp. SIO3I5]|uniref:hypothetical protein n=1 Tax=Okeania sp. SIO3I5 TaxID=2607805 RepID=UPI0013BD9C52|nr:hypothetical protein [Okeania sp. SIO3I5]NEQ39743.1 hypothetical protein [Okeania sp. SIO3I5]
MNNIPRQTLYQLIQKEGINRCREPKKCKAILSDLCGEYPKEISALVVALEEQVIDKLQKNAQGVPLEILLKQVATQIQNNRAISEEASIWAVESWAFVLGIYSPDLDNINPYPEYVPVGLIQYTLILSLSNVGNKIWSYSIDLTEKEEDNPQAFFQKNSRQEYNNFKTSLEREVGRNINSAQIDFIISKWCKQISLGYRTFELEYN